MTLEDYFKLIVKPTETKETTMFEYLKNKWTELWTTRYEFTTEEAPSKPEIVDYWAFEIQTSAYECDDEFVEAQHDVITDSNDGTWWEALDQILDVMSKHYGYNIKEQVYYSVAFPHNDPECPGYGRMLNDEVLQKLLLSFPEVYDFKGYTEQ